MKRAFLFELAILVAGAFIFSGVYALGQLVIYGAVRW